MKKITLLATAAWLLVALPAMAGPDVIEPGVDLWRTTGDGSTKVDFRFDPIPAGFFCKGSEPFTGTIAFRGVPVATVPAGILGTVDTLVERLDRAVFDKSGLATTRIRVRSLSFEGLAPVQTSCGSFLVTVGLNGEQPFTEMRILKESETGGTYVAPVSVNIRLTFERQDGKGWPVHLDREMRFRAIPNARWALDNDPSSKLALTRGDLFVDTDSDGLADSWVPGTTGFLAGVNFRGGKDFRLDEEFDDEPGGGGGGGGGGGHRPPPPPGCHCDYYTCGHLHCVVPCGGNPTEPQLCPDDDDILR